MAVVKKYAPGGKIGESFEDFADKYIESKKFGKTPPEELKIAARQFANLSRLPNVADVYKYDKLTDTYNVDNTKLPEDLKTYDWEGSTSKLKPNLLGRYTIKPNKDLSAQQQSNTAMATLFNEYLSKYGGAQTDTKEERAIPNIYEYASVVKFNNNSELLEKHLQNSPDKKAAILGFALENAQQYLKEYETNKNSFDYKDVDKVTAVRDAALSGDWKNFEEKANFLGWDVNYNNSPSKPTGTNGEPIPTKEELEEAARKKLQDFGITDKTKQDELIAEGFTNINPNYDPSGEGWLPDYLNKSKITALQNKEGITKLVKDNKYVGPNQFDRSNDAQLGHYWNQDTSGIVDYFWPKREGWDATRFADPLGGQEGGVQLQTSNLGQFADRAVFGYPLKNSDGTIALDKFGLPDYTKHITLEKEGMKPIELTWNNGKYLTDSGEELPNFKVFNYGNPNVFDLSQYIDGETDKFKEILPKKHYDLNSTIKIVEDITKDGFGANDIEAAKTILEDLKYKIKNPTSISERKIAIKLYQDLSAVVSPNKYRVINANSRSESQQAEINSQLKAINPNIDIFKPRTAQISLMNLKKKGGIIKAQKGILVKKDEALPSINVKNNIGRLTDIANDPLAATSLAGTALSVIPGVGAIGGLITTVADVEKDLRDTGKVDKLNLAANIGFTGLSLIGLGALRGAKVAAKLGSAAKEINVVKAATNVEKMTKLGVDVSKYDDAVKLVKEAAEATKLTGAGKIGVQEIKPTLEILAQKAGKSADEVLGFVTDMEKLQPEGFIKKAANAMFSTKVGANVAKAAGIGLVGVPAVTSTLSIVGDLGEGAGNIKVDDLGNVVIGASLAKNIVKELKAVKSITKMTVPTGEKPQSFTTTIDNAGVPKEISMEALPKKSKIPFKGYSDEAIKTVDDVLIKEGIPDDVRKIFLDKFKKEGDKLFKFTPATNTGRELTKDIEFIKENMTDFERAKKAIEKNYMVPGNPLYLRRDGGIIKMQNGKKTPKKKEDEQLQGKELEGITITAKNLSPKLEPKTIAYPKLDYTLAKIDTSKYIPNMSETPTNTGAAASGFKSKDPRTPSFNSFDPTTVADIARYAITINANNAALASLNKMTAPKGVFMNREYIKASSDAGHPYYLQAAATATNANKIAESINDLQTATAAKLTGQDTSTKLILEGKAAERAEINRARDMQQGSDRQTNTYNNQILNTNIRSAVELANKLQEQKAFNTITNAEGLKNLIQSEAVKLSQNVERGKQKKINAYLESPQVKEAALNYSNAAKDETFKANWEKWKSSPAGINARNQRWEDSSYYKDWKRKFDVAEASYNNVLAPIKKAYKSGGSLDEKKYLEELKQFHRKELLAIKLLYKNMIDSKNAINKLK